MHLTLLAVSMSLILLGLTIFRRQGRAASCPHHSRVAGRLAMAIGSLSLVAGISLLGYALYDLQ